MDSGRDDTSGGGDPSFVDALPPSSFTRMSYGRYMRVLLVQSDPTEAAAFVEACRESVLDVQVDLVESVDEAVDHLNRTSKAILRRPSPDVMVIGLGAEEAHRLLELVADDPDADAPPVIVLAEAASPDDERRSFALGATAHLVAPRRSYERIALVHALPDFIPRARAAHLDLEHRR